MLLLSRVKRRALDKVPSRTQNIAVELESEAARRFHHTVEPTDAKSHPVSKPCRPRKRERLVEVNRVLLAKQKGPLSV